MKELIFQWVNKIPNIVGHGNWISSVITGLLVLLIAAVAFYIAKRVLVYWVHKLFHKTASKLDDVLVRRKVFDRLAHLVPCWLIYELLPAAIQDYPALTSLVLLLVAIYSVIIVAMVVDALIDSVLEVYRSFAVSRHKPIQSFAQVAKLVTYFIAIIVIVSLVIGESALKLFAGLGAMTAILMLIFKDPILGFVAGIQLSYNNMVGIGDWVEIPQHKADGDILEIGLTTVKVRNFDNTITTVPTQSLINESFKNWRGMQESGGRRIKRSIYIDVNSISFCDEERLSRYSKIDFIKEYLDAVL